MIKKIFLAIMLVAGFAAESKAQEMMYLIKGNQVVAKYSTDDVDYISFKLPEGVKEDEVIINVTETGKNYITYNIKTIIPTKSYIHYFMQENIVNLYLLSYYGKDINTASEEEFNAIIRTLLYDGFLSTGSNTFTFRDGDTDGFGKYEILAGQRYIIAAADMNETMDAFGENLYYTIAETLPAERSQGTLNVSYEGLTEESNSLFKFEASDDIVKIYTMYGFKENLDYFINEYGLEDAITTFAGYFPPSELENDTQGWQIDGEADYSMYALGVDANGDWTEIQSVTVHIVPPVKETVGPQIKIFSKEKSEGHVSVNFEIAPSNVDEAYVRLMGENDCDNYINMGYTLPELAAGGDATDITNDIHKTGEYTYTNNEVPERWNSLLIMAKNEEGTTVTRINFWPDDETSTWDIIENKPFGKSPAKMCKPITRTGNMLPVKGEQSKKSETLTFHRLK